VIYHVIIERRRTVTGGEINIMITFRKVYNLERMLTSNIYYSGYFANIVAASSTISAFLIE
jgi:hypothetical protein